MVVPNQDGVSDCREFNVAGTLSGRSPGRATPDAFVVSHIGILTGLKARLKMAEEVAAPILRQYVTDKSFPIEERFKVWSKWCKKKVHGWVINESNAGIFGKMVQEYRVDFNRYVEYDWEYFLDSFKDIYDKLQEEYGVTMDDVKEALIETNFGSFTMDW